MVALAPCTRVHPYLHSHPRQTHPTNTALRCACFSLLDQNLMMTGTIVCEACRLHRPFCRDGDASGGLPTHAGS